MQIYLGLFTIKYIKWPRLATSHQCPLLPGNTAGLRFPTSLSVTYMPINMTELKSLEYEHTEVRYAISTPYKKSSTRPAIIFLLASRESLFEDNRSFALKVKQLP